MNKDYLIESRAKSRRSRNIETMSFENEIEEPFKLKNNPYYIKFADVNTPEPDSQADCCL